MASRLLKMLGGVVGLIVVGLVAVAAINSFRLDGGQLASSAEPVLERARQLGEKARPEYQELALATLPPNPLTGQGYRLDLMREQARLIETPGAKLDDSVGIVYGLEFDDPADLGVSSAGGPPTSGGAGALITSGSELEAFLTTADRLGIAAGEVGDIIVRAKIDKGNFFRLGWLGERRTDRESFSRSKIDVRIVAGDEFHTYVINGRNVLQRGLRPGERIDRLQLVASDDPDATAHIDFIRFVSRAARFAMAPNGVEYERLGDEQRSVLFMRPDQTLEYDVQVPADAPRLELGIGALLEARPLRFESEIEAAGITTPLLDDTVADNTGWRDSRIDLSAWAGQTVKLRLRVSGDAGNVGFWSAPSISSTPAEPFNVIVMIEDAQRADYLSVYGHPTRTTPFKEQLMAERGIVFEQAITQATKTRPSVASFMTSLYPTATGLWHFTDVLSERHLTLAEIMRSQGYRTAAFLQNGNAGPYAGLHQGFDRFFDEFAMGGETAAVFGGAKVRSWLEQNRDRNFFLYLHAIDPHAPYNPDEPFRSQYMQKVPTDARPIEHHKVYDPPWLERPSVESRKRLYEAEIEANDLEVKNFFALLDELGLAENTLVIMTSDHGEFLGERSVLGNELWDHRPPGYMATTHVPFMVVHPKRFPQPQRIAAPIQLLDMMPTVLDLGGVDRSDLLLQGDSLVPLIERRDPDRWNDRIVISEEPTAMAKGDPCTCGSVYFRDWQILSSRHFWPRRAAYQRAPHLQTFAATFALRISPDNPRTQSIDAGFLPDLLFRWRQGSILSELQAANTVVRNAVTAGDAGGSAAIDPDTLENLRGLGYIN